MPLPDGATLTGPAGLVPTRREAWSALSDAIQLDPDPIAFRFVGAGNWEAVLATLVIERDWATIAQIAEELRTQTAEELRT